MTSAEHAAAALATLTGHDAAGVDRLLSDPAHPAFAHIDALADAADSGDDSIRGAGIGALFAGVVEPLNDGFTLAGRAAYARLFTRAVWRSCARRPALAQRLATFAIPDESALFARYAAARHANTPAPAGVRRALILSRVTIGADILLTSVAVQRLRERYPAAEIVVLGDGKLSGLFGGFANVRVRPLAYTRRGPLGERLEAWLKVLEAIDAEQPDLVLNPDSRLDQLGILPVCAPERFLLWENTQPDLAQPRSLADLLDAWLARRLGLPSAPARTPRLALDAATSAVQAQLTAALGSRPLAAVKLDHGGNPAKALPREGEVAVLSALVAKGWRVLLDRGFGAEERANSDALCAALGWTPVDIDDSGKGLGLAIGDLHPDSLAQAQVVRFHGSIAGWAAANACCGLTISYDSVGHHLAAALGVPLVTAFTGHADAAFPIAWQPRGAGSVTVIEIPTTAKADPRQWTRVINALPTA